MRTERRPRGYLLLGALIALTGCATDPAPPATLPLDDLRAAIGTATEHRRREASVIFEERIAQCMHDQGFDYVPTPAAVEPTLQAEDARDFAARWGYGISTAPAPPVGPEAPPTSEAEQEAYDTALHGEWTALEEDGLPPGLGGCWEEANAARGGNPEDVAAAQTAGLAEELETLEMQIAVDARVMDQNRTWSVCMADAGFDVGTPADAPEAAILGGQEIVNAATDAEEPQVMADVQDLERRIALADLACQDDVDLTGTERRVRAEHEAAFVDQHGPEVESLIGVLEAAGAPAGSSG